MPTVEISYMSFNIPEKIYLTNEEYDYHNNHPDEKYITPPSYFKVKEIRMMWIGFISIPIVLIAIGEIFFEKKGQDVLGGIAGITLLSFLITIIISTKNYLFFRIKCGNLNRRFKKILKETTNRKDFLIQLNKDYLQKQVK